jgi:hypothetical protein
MKMLGTCPNMAHKSGIGAVFFSTEKSAKSELDCSFEVHLFGALYLSNRVVLGHVLVEL